MSIARAKALKETLMSNISKRHNITTQCEEEVKEAVKKINEKYQPQINSIDEALEKDKLELYVICKKLCNNSGFKLITIGDAIAKLITLIQEEDYEFTSIISNDPKLDTTDPEDCYGPNLGAMTFYSYMVVKSTEKEISVEDRENAIIFTTTTNENSFDDEYFLYKFLDSNIPYLSFAFDIKSFYYLREFIIKLVEYKIDNELNEIKKIELDNFVKQFAVEYKKMIAW